MSRIIRHQVGSAEVIALTDGIGQFGPEQFPATAPDEIAALLEAAGKQVIETNFNAFLIRSGGVNWLIDTGARELFGPTAGFLPEALSEAGVAPEDIDHLFITHMHPDHCAGAVTPDGQAVFANADLTLSTPEHNYWADHSNFTGRGAQAEGAYALAKSVFDAYADRLVPVDGHADLGAGLQVEPMAGHTPGHAGVKLQSGEDTFMIVADIVHAVDLQLPNPDIGVVYDKDGAEAALSRKRVLDMLATDNIPCSGGHFLSPGIGRIRRAGTGYRFHSEA